MKTLDRYIVRNFLISAALWFAIMMALRIVVDLFVNMDEYVKNATGTGQVIWHILSYYGYHSLEYFAELGGVIVVAAATFTLAMMGKTNELTAMLASGVSLHRVVWPIVLCSILMGGVIVIDQEMIIPIPHVARKLALPRDDIKGVGKYKMPFIADGMGSVWRADRFYPAESKLIRPVVFIRDADYSQIAGILAEEATSGTLAGNSGWMMKGARLLRTRQKDRLWPGVPDCTAIPTAIGPAQLARIAATLTAHDADNVVRARDLQYPMLLEAERFIPARAGRPARLQRPKFWFYADDGRLLATFLADSAAWSDADGAWLLDRGTLFCPSDLTKADLVLRRNRRWLDYMSSRQLTELLHLKRVTDAESALQVKHTRLTDPIDNLIMLLLALPFILSREQRDVKASASLCLLMVGAFYAFVHLCRYMGLPAAWAAWLPAMLFGPVSVVMLDSLKT